MRLVLLVGVVIAVQYFSLRTPTSQSLTPNSQSLPLPDRPSLIMLPLVNLSGDPEQEYFSDGLTEVLTGDLSKISSLFVIARNSAFTYKGKAVKVQDVSKEMGVRYVLEGSVQKANQRIRIAVQLIDATTGYHIWSQQYDRPLTDIFSLQDEIVQKIVTTLQLQLTLQEQGIIVRKHTNNVGTMPSCVGRNTIRASPKMPIPRRGRCMRKLSPWTRSMLRCTRVWLRLTTRNGPCTGVLIPRFWSER